MVGSGWEHKVMLPKNETLRQNWILKKPRLLTILILRIIGGVDQLRREYQEAQVLIAQANIVKLPESRIFDTLTLGFKKSGYIIAQRRLREDHSIAAIKKHWKVRAKIYWRIYLMCSRKTSLVKVA